MDVRRPSPLTPPAAVAPQLRAPRTPGDTGLDHGLLVELCAKHLLARGRQNLRALAGLLRLPPTVVCEVLDFMRGEGLVGVAGQRGNDEADYQLGEAGRAYASDAAARCQYAGPAPVTLDAYCAAVALHSVRHARIDAASVRDAFGGLEIAPEVVDQIGAAMNSGRAILLYGPAGSGKTFLAEHLATLLPGDIAVPCAIAVGGEIVQVFDPLVHEPAAPRAPAAPAPALLLREDRDERWVRCRRPVVIAGGELTLAMLDLQYDATAGYYQAPPHMKANGGLFVVDDLGRQLVAPRDLMNRWIVPLDRRRDYLSLHTGFRFAVPFDLTVLFSTNLRPDELADEAFLRRFGYKVHLGAMERASYRRVFESVCAELDVAFDAAAFDWLLAERHAAAGRPLLACYPRDLAGRVRDFALYTGMPAALTPEALARAWQTYFFTAPASDASPALPGDVS